MSKFGGVFGTIRLVMANRRQRALVENAGLVGDRLAQEASNIVLENTVRFVQPERDGFIPVGTDGESIRSLDSTSATELRTQARNAEYRSELLGGYLRTMKRFVVGRGPMFTPEDLPEEVEERVKDWWEKFSLINRWNELEDEIPARGWRDGEVFERYFVQKRDGPIPFELSNDARRALGRLGVMKGDLRSRDVPKGMTLLRFVDPGNVSDPSGTFTDGIVTATNDSQTVLGFIITPKGKEQTGEFVSTKEMRHHKLNVDSDVLRGRSSLEPILQRGTQFDDWVYARLLLSLARTSIVLHKQVTGSRAQGAAIRDANESDRPDEANDRRQKMYRAGTTITTGGNVKYEMMTPNLQARDAGADGRMLQLTMAAAVGIPEGMMTADWSNQNMASALVAQGPGYREFESWQDFWTPRYQETYRTVMVNAAEAGAIEGLSVEMAMAMKIEVEWPDIEVRDELKHQQANAIRHANKVLSTETWIKDDGRDFDTETQRLAEDRDAEIEFGDAFVDPDDETKKPDDEE